MWSPVEKSAMQVACQFVSDKSFEETGGSIYVWIFYVSAFISFYLCERSCLI